MEFPTIESFTILSVLTKKSMQTLNRLNILYLFILLSIIGNLLLLDNYHQWGDDFTLYLNQARTLLDGGYNDLYIANKDVMDHGKAGPYLYPIGYPILISPLFYFSDFNFIYFKLFNFIIYLIGLYFFYKITEVLKINKEISLVTILTILLSPIFFWHHNNVVSDIPSFTLSLICVYLYLKVINDNKLNSTFNLNILLLSFLVAFSIFTRTASIAILFSMIVVSFIKIVLIDKNIKSYLAHFFYLIFITVVFFILNTSLHLNRGDNEMKVFIDTNVFETIKHHTPYYIELITDPFTVILNPLIIIILDHTSFFSYKEYANLICIVFVCISFSILLIRYIVQRGIINVFITVDKLFIAFVLTSTVGIYIIWPSTQGHRFIFLIYPFIFLFLYCQVINLPKKINSLFLILVVLLLCLEGINNLKFNLFASNNSKNINEVDGRPGSKDFNQMMIYIKDSVILAKNKVIATNKPRLVFFFTHKKAYLPNNNTEQTIQYLFVRESEVEDKNIIVSKKYFLKKKIGKLLLYKYNEIKF